MSPLPSPFIRCLLTRGETGSFFLFLTLFRPVYFKDIYDELSSEDQKSDSPSSSMWWFMVSSTDDTAATWSERLKQVLSSLLCSPLARSHSLEVAQLKRCCSLCFCSAAREGWWTLLLPPGNRFVQLQFCVYLHGALKCLDPDLFCRTSVSLMVNVQVSPLYMHKKHVYLIYEMKQFR